MRAQNVHFIGEQPWAARDKFISTFYLLKLFIESVVVHELLAGIAAIEATLSPAFDAGAPWKEPSITIILLGGDCDGLFTGQSRHDTIASKILTHLLWHKRLPARFSQINILSFSAKWIWSTILNSTRQRCMRGS